MRGFFVLFLLAMFSGAAQTPLRAVATVGMLGDVVTNVGGDCVGVTTLMGPGVDPHLYRASARDVRTLADAGVIFYGGLRLEGQLVEVLGDLSRRRPTVAAMERIPEERLLGSPTYAGQFDPHLWMDASLWAETIGPVADALLELRLECEGEVRVNAERYRDELLALHAWDEARLASVPKGQRVLVTAHDAFAYFGRAYEAEVVGIQGISTEAEASLADIRGVVDLVVTREIPAVFVESLISPRTVNAVRAAARDRGWPLEVSGQLYSDAVGPSDTPEGSYIGMIRANILTITGALGENRLRGPMSFTLGPRGGGSDEGSRAQFGASPRRFDRRLRQ